MFMRYSVGTSAMNLTNACNVNCSCSEVLYEPICSHDRVQYNSPCHAGCLGQHKTSSSSVGLLKIAVKPHHLHSTVTQTCYGCSSSHQQQHTTIIWLYHAFLSIIFFFAGSRFSNIRQLTFSKNFPHHVTLTSKEALRSWFPETAPEINEVQSCIRSGDHEVGKWHVNCQHPSLF